MTDRRSQSRASRQHLPSVRPLGDSGKRYSWSTGPDSENCAAILPMNQSYCRACSRSTVEVPGTNRDRTPVHVARRRLGSASTFRTVMSEIAASHTRPTSPESILRVQNRPGGPPGTVFLDSVSCGSGHARVAVGNYFSGQFSSEMPLAETWNGKTWTIKPTPF